MSTIDTYLPVKDKFFNISKKQPGYVVLKLIDWKKKTNHFYLS